MATSHDVCVASSDPATHEASDEALVRAARVGDAEAFATIVRRHGPAMYRYAVRLLGSEHDATDATQEAFVSAWRSLGSFRGHSALRTWLFTLVSRRAADLRRTRRPTPIDDPLVSALVGPAPDNPLQSALDDELLAALRLALAELPWHQRAVWLLREIDGMTYQEIGTVLGLTTGSVRGHLHRGRKMLAERMNRWR